VSARPAITTVGRGIVRRDAIEQRGKRARQQQRDTYTGERAYRDQHRALFHYQREYVAWSGSQCHGDSDFLTPQRDRKRQHTIDADDGHYKCDRGKCGEEHGVKLGLALSPPMA
jgi:hypothetical protein